MKMTRNEYHEYLKNVYQEHMIQQIVIHGMTMQKKKQRLFRWTYPDIQILKDDTKEYINNIFDKEDTDHNGNYMLRGFIGDSLSQWYRDKDKLHCNYAPYEFYYSGFGFNDEEMLIYTWCEGDTTLTLFKDRYQKEHMTTEQWFEENT